MNKLFWVFLFVSVQAQAADYLCKNPEVPRMDYVIRQLDGKSYDFQVQKNTTDPFSARSRWGKDVETEVIYQETLQKRGHFFEGQRTTLDFAHPEQVTYEYVAKNAQGEFIHKSYVLNCELQ